MRRNPSFTAIFIGGGIAGVLDITYATGFSGYHGIPATRILQSVASGLLGSGAFEGGLPTAMLGLGLHFCIAFLLAAIFYGTSRQFQILIRQAVISGLLYGILVYAAMNLVVLPLSAYPRKVTFPPAVLITGLLVHMFFIGLPISLAARAASRKEKDIPSSATK